MADTSETNHLQQYAMGGSGELVQIRRKYDLIKPRPLPYGFRDRIVTDHVPRTRAECPADRDARGCKYVACPMHLWVIEGAERPGRRSDVHALPPTIIRRYSRTSCALDLAEGGPMRCRAIAAEIGTSHRRVEQLARKALLKLLAAGVDVAEFMALLAEEGHERVANDERKATPFVMRKTRAR